MNQKNDNLKFNKSVSSNSNINSKNIPSHSNDLKAELMDKYGLSSDDLDKMVLEYEKNFKKKKMDENYKKEHFNNDNVSDLDIDKNSKSNQVLKSSNDINDTSKDVSDNSSKMTYEESNDLTDNHNISKENKNVDSILADIIPDYNQRISIKLDHVDLTFEVKNEKVDTLKEAVIRTLKRDNSKKIKIHALKDISFQIYKGEKVGIIGYNGAGKSTLLNVITGIYPPDKGNVFVYGKISPLLSLGAGFDHNCSGRKNIILNGAILGYDKQFLESKIEEIIEFSELGEFIDIPIKNYSSGMVAKLGFSIATAVNPDILIIDEILGVGDVTFKKKSADKIKSLMDGGTTVLLVSHSIPQIRNLCDKAIWIENGSLRAIGEVNEVCDKYLKAAEKATNEQLANIELTN